MATRKRVCVVGAGVSGLAAANAFMRRGHAVTVFERAGDLGGVWEPSRSYPGIKTQSPKDLYRYTGRPMPEGYPEWPTGRQVYEYLRGFAEENGLLPLIRFGRTVTRTDRHADGGWSVETRDDDGASETTECDVLVVASGVFNDKNMPTHPGQDDFVAEGGTVLHSCEYTDPALVRDKDVVVLGFSKSATDVAVSAAKEGARSVSIVYREPVWRIPYRFGNVVNFKHILYARASERMFPSWGLSAAGRAAHVLAKPAVWANWRALETLLDRQFGLSKLGMRPDKPIEETIYCGLPVATEGFFELLHQGRITAYRGTFDHYEDGHVVLTGGERLPVDVAIQATGWKLGVSYLPEAVLDAIREPDGQFRLYRLIVNPDVPDLGFVGFNSSFASVLTSEIAAEWLVRFVDGMLVPQPTKEAMNAAIEEHLRWRRQVRPVAQAYGGLCAAPYHFRHLDELVGDMGCRVRARNPLANFLLPPNAEAYGRYVASAPDYRAAA
ncbi:NAD(P)/FAD-dependent oxidoreductase [Salinarimonas sp.]|uniref:flavin-containing monooxygenase n=1 Tax=Salinarimonas sp. TaxID=2766526 RepID=UPI0032D8F2AC